jgi:AraC-like DNA-binding protein
MPGDVGNLAALPGMPPRPCGYHPLGQHASFRAHDCVCALGVRSPTSEGEYSRASVGVILSGSFHARGSGGDALVGAGAMLLGNAGAGYEYRHVDDGGDRSMVFDYDDDLIDDARRSLGARGPDDRAFDATCLPASAGSAAAAALSREALATGRADALQEAALAALTAALGARRGAPAPAPAAHRRKIAQAMRHVEAHVAEDCSLDALAARAGLSTFHFLRLFRAHTGQTPRQFVIAARLRAAAHALRATRRAVIEVALDAGFTDLSHFHASFARAFGTSPRAYRLR